MRTTCPLALLAVLSAAPAQAPSAWVDLAVPGGTTGLTILARGQLVTSRNGSYLRVFSSATAAWHAHSPSSAATIHQKNNLLAIPEATEVMAFSGFRGRFVAQPVGAGATLVNPSPVDDDIVLVQDGAALHAFSAFTGSWVSRGLPAGASVQVRHRTALLLAPPLASAFDPYTGQWHDFTLPGNVLRSNLDGGSALAVTATDLCAFSAQRAGWTSIPSPYANPAVETGHDFFVAYAGDTATVYSGISGAFTTFSVPLASVYASNGLRCAVMSTFGGGFACGGSTGTWTAMPSQSQFHGIGSAVALFTGNAPGLLTAYSGVTGLTSSATLQPAGVNGLVASARGAGGQFVMYSALTSAWHPAPPDVSTFVTPDLLNNFAILRTNTGLSIFSARTGTFAPLARGPGGYSYGFLQTGNLLGVTDGSVFTHVYDGHKSRWIAMPVTPANLRISENVAIAAVGTDAAGFSVLSGRLEQLALPEPMLGAQAGSEVGHVRTATHVFAFSALAADTSLFAWPETPAATGQGSTFRHQVRLPQGSFAFAAVGVPLAQPAPVPPFGDLWLDANTIAVVATGPEPGEDRRILAIPIPQNPSLRNSEWYLQAMILPGSGQPFLCDPAHVRLQ